LQILTYFQCTKHGNAEKIGVFRVPLHHLDHEVVLLKCGTTVEVPGFVARACSYIKQHIETEGIFRKAGSASRQKALKVWYVQKPWNPFSMVIYLLQA
jgi:hypothetical protein